jgi:hypothetical protein
MFALTTTMSGLTMTMSGPTTRFHGEKQACLAEPLGLQA